MNEMNEKFCSENEWKWMKLMIVRDVDLSV